MFTLPESAVRARRSPAGMAWSCLLHAGVLSLVTLVSGLSRDLVSSMPAPTRPDSLVWITTLPEPATRGRDGTRSTHGARRAPGAPAVPAPIEVPTTLLPPNQEAPVIDIIGTTPDADAGRMLREGSSRSGGSTSPVGDGGPWRVPDRIATARADNPRPRYPDMLRSSRIEGRVTIDCVVDTTGTIDLSTIRVIDADHAHFTAAVREVLPRLRFAPAQAGGQRVRQWVRIPFEFRLSTPR